MRFHNNEHYSNEVFGDGYREPGDDVTRLWITLFRGIQFFAGIAIVLAGFECFIKPGFAVQELDLSGSMPAWIWGILFVIGGIAEAVFSIRFFARESRHWHLKGMTADRFVASAIILGVTVFFFTARLMLYVRDGDDFAPLAKVGAFLGGGILAVGVISAITFAVIEKAGDRKRVLRNVVVDKRYAMDDRYVVYWDCACPADEGMAAVVELVSPDGTQLVFSATQSAYEFADPGARGEAVVHGRVLDRFRRLS